MARNIMTFDTDDVKACIGREPTESEYHAIVKSLANNEFLTELITDTFYTFTTDEEQED